MKNLEQVQREYRSATRRLRDAHKRGDRTEQTVSQIWGIMMALQWVIQDTDWKPSDFHRRERAPVKKRHSHKL